MSCKDIFEEIYKDKKWGELGAGSGEGSDPLFTQGLVKSLSHIINQLGVTSLHIQKETLMRYNALSKN
jgi:hypothetical protein